MSKEEVAAVKDAVHQLQIHLLEGIEDEDKLFAAGSIMSQSDYQDVVTERSIANMCGYPLCSNNLPLDRPRKGHYRISLKEHKVYDLQETYLYCSTSCVVNSRAFAGSMQEERVKLNLAKVNEVLGLFSQLSLADSKGNLRNERKEGLSELRVQEKTDIKDGEVSMEEWVGPSNAIEGYIPRDQPVKPKLQKKREKGFKPKHQRLNEELNLFFDEKDFTSTIIVQDEYNISKDPGISKGASDDNTKESKQELSDQPDVSDTNPVLKKYQGLDIPGNESSNQARSDLSNKMKDKLKISDMSSASDPSNRNAARPDSEINNKNACRSVANGVKSSLKRSNDKNITRSVTWADEKTDGGNSQNLCTFEESVDCIEDSCERSYLEDMETDDSSYRYASAEACALALAQAADAVASEGSDVLDAVAEAGIIILPPEKVDESEIPEEDDLLHAEQFPVKWPTKPGLPDYNVLESNDSWYDSPPEDFNLSLSPFATMFMTLFAWISSSSLAYIYGHDESLSEEYSCINGREYPGKVVSSDGRSSEIRQALAGCLARALPGLIAALRLPMAISTLEKELDHLLDTMSFMDPLPPFRAKQWQLVVLLLLDAISVCRIPGLGRYMTGRRIWLPKILEGAQISAEEYEIMKDLIIPLGRVPQIASQSGG